jgi:hypothetical protein
MGLADRSPWSRMRRWIAAAALACAALATAQTPPGGAPPAPADIDLSRIPDELLTPEGRRQKEQLRRGGGGGATGVLPGTGGGTPPPPDTRAVDHAQSLLDTVEPIIPRANRDLEAILAHAEAVLGLSNACAALECPVVDTCEQAAALAQALVDAEAYLDAGLGALNRAAAASAEAHSNVVAQTRITSANLDHAIRVLAIQEYLTKFASLMFDLASLAGDLENMAKEGTVLPGDNWAAKADTLYETIKDLETVIVDGAKIGTEYAGGDAEAVKGPVGELTGELFGLKDSQTGLANDLKSSLSDAANAVDDWRRKIKEAEDKKLPLDSKAVAKGLAGAAGKIAFRALKARADQEIAQRQREIDELLANLKAEERILAELFLQRGRIATRRHLAEDALRTVRAAKAALMPCLARACGASTLTRPVLPDYYAPPAGMRPEDLARYFGWGTALRDLNVKLADAEVRLRERFGLRNVCTGRGGGGGGGVGVIPGGSGGRVATRVLALCPECQPIADRAAAAINEAMALRDEVDRIEANLRRAAEMQQRLNRLENDLRDIDRRRAAIRERLRGAIIGRGEMTQDLAVLDGERVRLIGEILFVRREIERLEHDRGALDGLRSRLESARGRALAAQQDLRACEERLCRPVIVDLVVPIDGVNPFDPTDPIGVVGGTPPVQPPTDGPGYLQFASPAFGGAEGGAVAVTVVRTGGAKGAVGVSYASAPGTAASGADFVPANGILAWADGEASPKTISIALPDDAIVESTETFTVTLAAPTGGGRLGSPATTTISITDNDSPPPPQPAGNIQLSASSYSVAENQAAVTITATRTGGSNGTVAVQYFTGPSSAAAGADYQPANGTLAWESGDAAPKSFSVPIVNDTQVEGPEAFFVTLNSPTGGATLGAPATATVTIADDDVATGPCGPAGSAWQPNAGAAYVCSGNCDPCPSPQTITVSGDRVTVSPFHAGGPATFTGCSASLPSDSSTLTYFGQSNHRATITRTGNNTFSASIVSSGGGTCSMSCFRAGP